MGKRFDVDAVLGRAMETFWARGYEATSMQDLVQRTGVNRASLYATYGDKKALFLASLRMYDGHRRRDLLAHLEAGHTPRAASRHLFKAFTADVSERGGNKGCFLTNTALELAARNSEARSVVAHAQVQVQAFLERMIRKGKASGDIARDLPVRDTARGLLASLLGLVVLVRSRPDRALIDSVAKDALR